MIQGNHQGSVLKDHKKVGKKLIPPLMQLPNLKETSFRDNTLPCLVWFSAIFLRNPDRQAVHNIVEFLIKCGEILSNDEYSPLAFLNNFDKLIPEQKKRILNQFDDYNMLTFICQNLVHQFHLFKNYPSHAAHNM